MSSITTRRTLAAVSGGLGLALASEHVRLHGGRVWSEDAPGGGTRFVVELPLHPDGGDGPDGQEFDGSADGGSASRRAPDPGVPA